MLEVDTYWVEVGGDGAAELLARLGDKVQFLHVKDGPEPMDDTEQVAVGKGTMPSATSSRAAPEALRGRRARRPRGRRLHGAAPTASRFLDGVRA